MENQTEKNMENEAATGLLWGFIAMIGEVVVPDSLSRV